MGLAYSIVNSTVYGDKRVITADVTFDNSYVTGGEPVTPSALGLGSILHCNGGSKAGNLIQYDPANVKLLAYVSSTGVQVANAVDLSAVTIRLQFTGQ
jgi:hypothetical protein